MIDWASIIIISVIVICITTVKIVRILKEK